jgi:hypothetical protein
MREIKDTREIPASVDMKLKPFSTPNFVLVHGQPDLEADSSRVVALSEIDAYTLHALCQQFYADVFEKAGKQPPPKAA